MTLMIKNVTPDTIHEFSSILIAASRWLKENNKEMWRYDELTVDALLNKNDISEMFIGCLNNEAVATIIVQQNDPVFWPGKTNNNALYIHKLAVKRACAGRGISIDMIHWVKNEAERQNKKYIRLDCASDRESLCRFYEKQGFKHIEDRQVDDFHVSLYEYKI